MSNAFIKTIEIDIIPIFEKIGAKVLKKTPNEAAFLFKDMEISIYLERGFEVYATILSLKLNKSVYLSEILSDYLNLRDRGIYHLSDRFTMEMCVKNIVDIIISEVVPLVLDGRINEAINTITLKRKEDLGKYYEDLAEKEAEKAFKEQRYDDVILHYSKIKKLDDVQKKRLNISLSKLKK
jgi:hypothetical protein